MSGFVMLGASDVPVCEDGVCVVPSAEQVDSQQVDSAQISAEAPPR